MPWESPEQTYVRTNGDGITGTQVWQTEKSRGIFVLALNHDSHDQDIADAINACWTKDGQNVPSSTVDMRGFKFSGVGDGTTRNSAMSVAIFQDASHIYGGTSTGAANVYAATLSPAISSYVDGMMLTFLSHQANTSTTPTLNVNSVGAKTITKTSGALAANDIVINKICWVAYDGDADVFQLLNPTD